MKTIIAGAMPLSEFNKLRGHRCAWRGCRATTPLRDELPRDWRWLMLWWGPAGHNPMHLPTRFLDRDAVLCPLHAGMLHNEVLEDIGQRLGTTEGSA